MEMMIILAVIVAIGIRAIGASARNKTIQKKKELLNQQRAFFDAMIGQSPQGKAPSTSPGFANPQADTQTESRPFSIGWIVFFVLAALFLGWLFRPYLIGVQLFGLEEFVNIMSSGG